MKELKKINICIDGFCFLKKKKKNCNVSFVPIVFFVAAK